MGANANPLTPILNFIFAPKTKGSGATSIDILGIAAAFGLTIVAMAYGIGQVSGCHINPAISFGVLVAGRMSAQDFVTYVIAQILGAIAGAAVLYLILSGKATGWGWIARPEWVGTRLSW